ncbi:LysR family transcriptional regulator [Salinactinospora qingdaonensis]|uniref:LysR substrate-binding domain-containing protein n=1 Tax=Salinactinospora qingdaonensis TaxID=702744 RepID=A0ABP7FLS8_9ACTN
MSGLDIRQLECFIAVAEEGHIGRAAARLHMTQPPLTRRINRLEHDVGVRLFQRTPTGMALTEPGTVLLDRAYRIVRLSEHAVERTRLADTGQVGHLVVGYFGSTIFEVVPRLLRGFVQAHPDVTFTLERAPKNVQAEAVWDGRMHVGFSRTYRDEPGLLVRQIAVEPLFVALPSGHPLLSQGEVRLADLRDEDMVLFPAAPRPSFADEISQFCKQAGFAVRAAREAEDAVTALAYVAAGGLCAVVPRSATTIGMPGVSYVPLTDGPLLELSCVHRAGEPAPVLRAFLSYLDTWCDSPP